MNREWYIDSSSGSSNITLQKNVGDQEYLSLAIRADEKGDVQFYLSWQPGIRVRCYKNLHIFLGPTLSTHCLGVHLGIGF